MTLGEKLTALRKKKNYSHEQLALELELSKTSIIKWEQDKVKPSFENLLKLCILFEKDVNSLLQNVTNASFIKEKNSFSIKSTKIEVPAIATELLKSVIDNQIQIQNLIKSQNELIERLIKPE
ncbi:helix-turn-helix transcriptional regulator [Flavobacterium aciduliphilum]|uniref:DNA-binding XRE family transcriptional regulator n=1 Tax=Flavobacterium aciduliphilum TaxID=1101402 RepID=A0A328YU34_9FLAO|nr:helix-turn-helix transcriptional regulator [Flavobacterium aciduliphilum]RAR75722.1 DNA-binding XRE family transcriptional regulator [Flavobacterium aciduliphilum]